MKCNLSIFVLVLIILCKLSLCSKAETQCHPQCSWKCDDPHCPAICDPVCEPPKCHTSCGEPKNAICDVKCEKPECEIKCPDKGCEQFDCPKCVSVCKQPHCVTHCQAPKPECEAVCEEPKCDWKCHKPNCPKPKCELVCENPSCTPKTECCACSGAYGGKTPSFPFFKETEPNQKCCGCNTQTHDTFNQFPRVTASNSDLTNTKPSSVFVNTPDKIMLVDKTSKFEAMKKPKKIGVGQFTRTSFPESKDYLNAVDKLNLDINYHHKKHKK